MHRGAGQKSCHRALTFLPMRKPKHKGHGGRRPGAGRPLSYGYRDMLAIGEECEARWRQRADNAAMKEIADRAHVATVRDEQDRTQHIRAPRRDGEVKGRVTRFASQETVREVGTEINRTLAGSEAKIPPLQRSRIQSAALKKPWGQRGAIIAEVAALFRVSRSRVARAWTEARRINRLLPP